METTPATLERDRIHFDAVIIGSGFGGSVMAYRLAESGLRVCLLERGKEYPPGSFPRSPHDMKSNFWDPSRGLQGLFDVWSFRKLAALVSSGLGGGSLIYSNVLIRKDEKWFVKEDSRSGAYEHWPITRADLDPHYDQVERMLDSQCFPLHEPPYDQTAKTLALRGAAKRLGLEWYLPKLAISFANRGEPPAPGVLIREAHPNLHQRARVTCQLCGECNVGCNYGSKNTLDYNYLSAARRHGAEIWTRCEVRGFAPLVEGGFAISYVHHDPARAGQETDTSALPRHTLVADRLILAAGTLGSSYLLLKSAAAFPALSKCVGTRFSDNGDLLTFALLSSSKVLDASRGPVITSTLRVPDEADGGDGPGFYLQDAGFPATLDWLLEAVDVPNVLHNAASFVKHRIGGLLGRDPKSEIGDQLSSLFGDCHLSTRSLPLLAMGRSTPDGTMGLRDGYLDLRWSPATSEAYFERVRDTGRRVASVWEAEYKDAPSWYLKRALTVHPLGGCPIGRHPQEGVSDSYGEVFGYPGFYITDGSAMPGPVGPNPSLTIAAFANRTADHIIERAQGPGTGGMSCTRAG